MARGLFPKYYRQLAVLAVLETLSRGVIVMVRASLTCVLMLSLASCHHSDGGAVTSPPAAEASAAISYKLLDTLKIGGEGGWDYLTLDATGKRLYITRTTHTMIVDTADGKTLADISGTQRAHGVALAPEANRGFITDGKAGTVTVFDLDSHEVLGTVAAADDADGIVYDPASRRVWVTCGDAGVVAPIDADVDLKSGKSQPLVQLGGKPEFLVADGRGKLYVASQDKNEVVVVDTVAMKVVAHWPTLPGMQPTGMAMDRKSGRVFVGCRNQKMIVMDAANGAVIADLPIGKGVDAAAFDRGAGLASCGDGTLTVVRESPGGKLVVSQVVTTERGARTMAVDSVTGKIYLATADFEPVPAAGAEGAKKRPKPVPGTFRILVLEPVKGPPAQ